MGGDQAISLCGSFISLPILLFPNCVISWSSLDLLSAMKCFPRTRNMLSVSTARFAPSAHACVLVPEQVSIFNVVYISACLSHSYFVIVVRCVTLRKLMTVVLVLGAVSTTSNIIRMGIQCLVRLCAFFSHGIACINPVRVNVDGG